MTTTSFTAFARRFSGNRQQNSEKKRKAMKFLKSLFVLATLGISSTAHAAGWRLITPARIEAIESNPQDNATTLWLKATAEDGSPLNNTCSSQQNITIFRYDPRHDQVYTMLTTALVAGRKLEVYVLCDGGSGRFGTILLK